jgi:hypothetical protein
LDVNSICNVLFRKERLSYASIHEQKFRVKELGRHNRQQ